MDDRFEPIALVGLGCRMPGDVHCLDDYQRVMESGQDVLSEVPPDRWDLDKFWHPDPHHVGTHANRRAGFMKNVHDFDHTFFNTSPREAGNTDVQQRQLLEVTQEALDDAGIPSESLPKTTGVYIGIGLMDHGFTVIEDPKCMNAYTHTGSGHSVAANRISYFYDIRGPSVAIDTACAASLTSMHYACFALWNKECPLAIVGGCNTLMVPEVTVGFSALGVLAPDGKSCPFSAHAQGYVRSEGVGVVVLEPLSKALANNHHVYCVIRGTLLGHNGYSLSITMPSTDAQAALMRETYEHFNLRMDDIAFVEAHGTGTPVGDPIEAEAIAQAFAMDNPKRKKHPLYVGSGKSHFGHLECAAGMNQIVKIVLMLKNRVIYPNINFGTENPKIDCKSWNIRIPEEEIKFTSDDVFRVGVNTFGFGGALAHMIFEEYHEEKREQQPKGNARWKIGPTGEKGQKILFPLSAKSSGALKATAAKWIDFVSEHDAQEVACWMATRRSHYSNRLCVMADSGEDLKNKLQMYIDKTPHDEIVEGTLPVHQEKYTICFVFPGQGQQSFDIGRNLYREEPIFRAAVDACDAIYKSLSGISFLEHTKLFIPLDDIKDYDPEIVNEIHISQPAILFLQVGMFKLLQFWGVNPHVVIGHSLGEVAASYACGALNLQEAVTVQYNRAQQQAKIAGTGAMAALRVTPEEGAEICKGYKDLHVACINAPESITLAGSNECVKDLCERNPENAKQIRVKCAFHTKHMDTLCSEFLASMKGKLRNEVPKEMPMYSTVTGGKFETPCDAKYCWDNIREQVKFSPAVEGILEDFDNIVFVELAGSATLLGCVRQICKYVNQQPAGMVACGQRSKDDRVTMLRAVSSLHTMGVKINWGNLLGNCGKWMKVPRYAWQHQTFRYEAETARRRRLDLDDTTYKGLNGVITLELQHFLKDHLIKGDVTFPKSGFMEYMIQSMFDELEKPHLSNVVFNQQKLIIPEEVDLNGVSPERISVDFKKELTSKGHMVHVEANGVTYATAEVVKSSSTRSVQSTQNIAMIKNRCPTHLTASQYYDRCKKMNIQYEDELKFRNVKDFYLGDGEALAYLNPVVNKRERLQTITVDAVLTLVLETRPIDCCYHFSSIGNVDMLEPKLPYKADLLVYVKITFCNAETLVADASILDEQGRVLVSLSDITGICTDQHALQSSDLYCTISQPNNACLPPLKSVADSFSKDVLKIKHPYDLISIEKSEPYLKEVRSICAMYAKYGIANIEPSKVHSKMERYYGRLCQMASECHFTDITVEMLNEKVDYVIKKAPGMELEMQMIQRMGTLLPESLEDPRHGLTELFKEDMMGAYFIDSITTRVHYKVIADIVAKVCEAAAQKKELIRVLEVGGRLGGLTSHILGAIKHYVKSGLVNYTFTDINVTFFNLVKDKFTEFPEVIYQQFDPEFDAKSQSISENAYDIVVCLDTLHCTENAVTAAANIKDLLADDGWLIVMESTNNHNTPEIIFGIFDLCWIFEDGREDRCWLSQKGWVDVLTQAGFKDSYAISTSNEFFHSLILGRNSLKSPVTATPSSEWLNATPVVSLAPKSPISRELTRYTDILEPQQINVMEGSEMCDSLILCSGDTSIDKLKDTIDKLHENGILKLCAIIDEQGNAMNLAAIKGFLKVLSNERREEVNISCIYVDKQCENVASVILKAAEDRLPCDKDLYIRNGELQTERIVSLTLNPQQPKRQQSWNVKLDSSSGNLEVRELEHTNSAGVEVTMSAYSGVQVEDQSTVVVPCSKCVCAVGKKINNTLTKSKEESLIVGLSSVSPTAIVSSAQVVRKPSHYSSQEAVASCLPYTIAIHCLADKLSVTDRDTVLITSAFSPVGCAALAYCVNKAKSVLCLVTSEDEKAYVTSTYKQCTCIVSNEENSVPANLLANVTCVLYLDVQPDYALLDNINSDGRVCFLESSKSSVGEVPGSVLASGLMIHSCVLENVFGDLAKVSALSHNAMHFAEELRLPCLNHKQIALSKVLCSDHPSYRIDPSCGIPTDVLQVDDLPQSIKLLPKSTVLNAYASYVIAADISDFVLELLEWMSEHGGRFVILLSNTRPNKWLHQSTLKRLERSGMTIKVIQCDATDEKALLSVMQTIKQNGVPPIKGIFLFNPVSPFQTLDSSSNRAPDSITNAVISKVSGALNINNVATKLQLQLDHFIMFGSSSSCWGCPGTAIQTAADSIIEQMMRDRRSAGAPGLLLQCGWVGGVTWQQETLTHEREDPEDDGGAPQELGTATKTQHTTCSVRDVMRLLHQLLAAAAHLPPVVSATLEDWNTAYEMTTKDNLLFRHLVSPDGSRKVDCNLSREELEAKVVEKLAGLLMMSAEDIDQTQPMVHYGVDSLISLDITNWMRKEFNLQVNQMDILEGMTTETLIQQALG